MLQMKQDWKHNINKIYNWMWTISQNAMYYQKTTDIQCNSLETKPVTVNTEITNKILTPITFIYIMDSDCILKDSLS